MSHKSYSSLSSNYFATDFCFNEGLPLFAFSLLSQNTLRLPAKTIQFSLENLFFMSSLSSLTTCTCSSLILAL